VSTVSYASVSVALSLLVLVMLAAIFIWVAGGRHAEMLLAKAARTRILRPVFVRSYVRDLEKADPLAARAFAKIDRFSRGRSLANPEVALAILTPAERRAYLTLVGERPIQSLNREQRRRTRS
jgi:hypothetical protein